MVQDRIQKPYKTIEVALRHEIDPIKNSRFITEARPLTTEAEANDFLAEMRKEMPDACHHCWAYQLRDPQRIKSSDDGEPGGSAGRPILAVLQGRELFDVMVVVTRYFGGTKLGVGGLMRAYGGGAAKTLDRAKLREVTPTRSLWLQYSYDATNQIQCAVKKLGLELLDSQYTDQVQSMIKVPFKDWEQVRQELINQSSGHVRFKEADA
ncbi:MAG: YigZ family protein [Planctomycetota bacterium]|nr:YigZ family protein [Planctomycetota bacterium]